jgi:hypothetical protein
MSMTSYCGLGTNVPYGAIVSQRNEAPGPGPPGYTMGMSLKLYLGYPWLHHGPNCGGWSTPNMKQELEPQPSQNIAASRMAPQRIVFNRVGHVRAESGPNAHMFWCSTIGRIYACVPFAYPSPCNTFFLPTERMCSLSQRSHA